PMEDAWAAAQQFSESLIGVSFAGDDLVADRQQLYALLDGLKTAASNFPLTTTKPPLPGRELRATLCGFDIALLSLLGQIYRRPLFEVLGPRRQESVSIAGVTQSLGISPGKAQQAVLKANSNYRCVRFKIGSNAEEDLAMLRAAAMAVRSERPELELFVDVNQGWKDADHAIEELARIRQMLKDTQYRGRFICEQPTDEMDFEALAEVTRVTRQWAADDPFQILIMADETVWDLKDVQKLVALDAVDQINIKIQKAGGLVESLRMADYLAQKKPEWEVYVGGLLMTDVGAWANLQLGYCLPRLDYMTGALPRRTNAIQPALSPLLYKSGTRTLVPPADDGLGTELDRETLKPYLVETYQTKTKVHERKS
ncbi:MAG: enolase C-terminal domain-like protein, partial [Verrucomicrobiota bacterium]